jgi:uncharacterized protein
MHQSKQVKKHFQTSRTKTIGSFIALKMVVYSTASSCQNLTSWCSTTPRGVLNDEQQKTLEDYVSNGGTLIGIHGAGDNSHHWDWYVNNLVGAEFSHHSLHPQFQETTIKLHPAADTFLTKGLATTWIHADEWYVFKENPGNKGFNILYTIDGEKINPSGNILWMTDLDFGMGKDHPVAWSRASGAGRTFYTSLGHDETAWKQQAFVRMLENAVNW